MMPVGSSVLSHSVIFWDPQLVTVNSLQPSYVEGNVSYCLCVCVCPFEL